MYTRPQELNLIGVRKANSQADCFDDVVHVWYTTAAGAVLHHVFRATTHPGRYWLQHPQNASGTAILEPGQYVDAYCLGLHRGRYEALVQAKPVVVRRDNNRNEVADYTGCPTETGLFGINIHRAAARGVTGLVGRYSAGCQVIADANDYARLMALCRQQRALYGNRFTYTLLQEDAAS